MSRAGRREASVAQGCVPKMYPHGRTAVGSRSMIGGRSVSVAAARQYEVTKFNSWED